MVYKRSRQRDGTVHVIHHPENSRRVDLILSSLGSGSGDGTGQMSGLARGRGRKGTKYWQWLDAPEEWAHQHGDTSACHSLKLHCGRMKDLVYDGVRSYLGVWRVVDVRMDLDVE